MKKLITICAIIGMVVTLSGVAKANFDQDEYDKYVHSDIPVLDSGWAKMYSATHDPINGWGDDRWILTLTVPGYLTVQVDDCCIVGDYYGMYVDSVLIGSTPVVPWMGSPPLSSGSATTGLLGVGVHTIEIRDLAFLAHQPPGMMCPAGYWVTGTLTPIPAPGAILLGSLGVALVGWLRRRRTL